MYNTWSYDMIMIMTVWAVVKQFVDGRYDGDCDILKTLSYYTLYACLYIDVYNFILQCMHVYI